MSKRMNDKAEQKEAIARMSVALAAYRAQKDRLLKQAEDAKALAAQLNLDYANALIAYLPTPEAQAKLQALAEGYDHAVRSADKSSVAANGFDKMQNETSAHIAEVKAANPSQPYSLSYREDRVFNVMKVVAYTGHGQPQYGLHDTMLKADVAYAKALALAAKGRA